MSTFRQLFLLFASVSYLAACPPAPENAGADSGAQICASPSDGSAVVVQSGSLTVTQTEFDAELLSIPERARARYENDKDKGDLANRILLNKALFQKVEAEGLVSDPVVQQAARMAAEKAYVNALFKKLEAEAVSEQAVMAHYEENKARFSRPMVRARHILVKDESLAGTLLAQINAGGDFAALAQEHSEDRGSKGRGGELPWSGRDRWVKEFGDAAFSLAVNEVSPLVQSKYGFHIIQALEKRDMQPIEEVRPGIERLLSRNAVRDYRETVRTDLGLPAPGANRARAGSKSPAPRPAKLPGASQGSQPPGGQAKGSNQAVGTDVKVETLSSPKAKVKATGKADKRPQKAPAKADRK